MADPKIIRTQGWGAVQPSHSISSAGKPTMIIFHHTAGHHPEIDHKAGETEAEGAAYARSLQHDHMVRRGFADSGHNFLVTRSGHIFEGRHGSLDAIKAGKMVVSAHCIGKNTHPGVEHEHAGDENMTQAQRQASVALLAFICRETGIDPDEIHPHKQFNSTECPGVLGADLAQIRRAVAEALA